MIASFITLVILLVFSAFFSGAEIALMSLSDLRVRHLVETKRRNSRRLQRLKQDPHKLLITVLIGNNFANISAASLATTVSINILQNLQVSNVSTYGIGITTGLMTLIILIFGEIAPKSFCISNAEKVSLAITPAIQFFEWLFSPFAFILIGFTRLTSGNFINKPYPMVTEEEVRTIVKIGEEEGSIQQEEKEMIHNVFELDNTEVSSIMTPRVDMFMLDAEETISATIEKIQDKVYSRIPVYVENADKIVGIAYAKDILHAGLSGKSDNSLRSIARPAIYIPENMFLNVLLQQFKSEKTHIALVVDEHGGTAGLVTIEDVLEELVGEIYDETDKPENLISQIDRNTYKVKAKISIGDLNDSFKLDLDEDESYDTLSGLILNKLGEIPDEGEIVKMDNISFTVSSVEEHRIVEVILKKENVE